MSGDISLKILSKSLGEKVLVKLRNGKLIRGLLQGYDQHLNLVLENAEEVIDQNNSNQIGTIVVRGDNIIMISTSPKE
ncbi:MAG: RNA-binding protein [Thaumarchaeota archaeon]|jgi:small nuclear ribonucleoprotein|nr:RNA-binding protein [Candidatus Terraquivivens yellowstonensis]MCL7387728.1 RNA-binding protein [Candidatus Terraquivivens yellowstonensis]MCL7395191.1 RNA-binding protein [Candidatus Terraquivivens yellowstonensis]MCL7398048.1 RNA-binding protein [Candidatus Terraquivivens yellowstonensis]MCL7398690.1 RNA-binding protein [Candidatus Terraquivivens yellowstonensis]